MQTCDLKDCGRLCKYHPSTCLLTHSYNQEKTQSSCFWAVGEHHCTRRYRTQAWGEHGNLTCSTKTWNLNQNLLPMTVKDLLLVLLFIDVSIYWIITFQYFLVLCFLGFLAHLDLRTQANKTTTAVLRQEVRVHSGRFTRTSQGQQTYINVSCITGKMKGLNTHNTSLM